MLKKLYIAFEIYDENLNNKKVIFKFNEKKFIECLFKEGNFLHLTGVKPNIDINAKNFYKKLKKKQIKDKHIFFDDNSKMKLSVFDNLRFNVGDKVLEYEEDNFVYFESEHKLTRNSAILCIKNGSPQSLLKKNKPQKGKKCEGEIISITNLF